jgi:hypothetical protein
MGYGYVTPTDGFTIELWFKRDAIVTSETLINSRTQASVNWTTNGIATGYGRQLLVEILGPSGAFAVTIVNEGASSGTNVTVFTDPSPSGYATDNQWHHLAFRLGTNKIAWALFLDGELYMSGNTSAAVNWKPGFLTFGAQYAPHMGDHGSLIWGKWLSYIAVYDHALTDNRIFEHYTAGSGGTVYYGDDEVTRLHRIADWAEVPDQSREFESPLIELQGIQVANANALTSFQETANAATGLIYADGQSRLVYHNRRHRYNRWNVVTLAESTDSAPEIGLTFTIDDANIYNDVRGDRPYGSTVRLVNEVSKAAHGRKTYSFSLPVTTHEELQNAVTWISSQYRDAVVRVSSINFRAESSDVIEWIGTGGLNIGDHITLDELPAEAAPEVTMEFTVEKISLNVDIKNKIWNVALELSPFYINRVFQVGVSNLGNEWKVAY